MSEIENIARTVGDLASPGMKPKDLLSEVRKKHPGATKKDLSRAAYMAAILAADSDPERASRAHNAAYASRTMDDEAGVESGPAKPRRRKSSRESTGGAQQPANDPRATGTNRKPRAEARG